MSNDTTLERHHEGSRFWNVLTVLRGQNAGAILLLSGAVLALIWANSPFGDSYRALTDVTFGPKALGLDLSLAQWATDGLLAIFFFVVGIELKREIVTGELRRFSTAIVPIVAAIGGMVIPALVYTIINRLGEGGDPHGWAIPVATDIAFAIAVLAIFGKGLPNALRIFLLTLAVVDDLLGITIIAIFYTDDLAPVWILASLATIALFAVVARRAMHKWRPSGPLPWLLVLLAVLAWGFMHASGVHATIAGVLLGLTIPAVANKGQLYSLAARYEHFWQPVSAGLAVPVFAFFAAGVSMAPAALLEAATHPVAQGVFAGLVIGKPIGIILATWLLVVLTKARLDASLRWWDVFAAGSIAGIGFTVALLIGELSFTPGSENSEAAKAAVLIGSLASALIGASLLSWRSRVHLRMKAEAQAQDTESKTAE